MNTELQIIQKAFPLSYYQERTHELIAICPNCGDAKYRPDKKKLCINIAKRVFHCWVCEYKGRSIPRLLMKVNRRVAEEYSRKMGIFEDLSVSESITRVTLPIDFKLVMDHLWNPEAKIIRGYCHVRGLTDNDIWRYRIGFSPEQRGRLIIPSFDEDGNLNYWTARRIDDNPDWKYINAKADKTQFIFGEIDHDWTKDEVVLVEGPWDWMKCDGLNCLPLLGSTLRTDSELFRKLILYPEKIVLALDNDASKKRDRIARELMQWDKEVWYVNSPTEGGFECDWGDLSKNENYDIITNNRIKYESNTYLLNKIMNI